MKQETKNKVTGLVEYSGGLVCAMLGGWSYSMNAAEKIFTMGVGASLMALGIAKTEEPVSIESSEDKLTAKGLVNLLMPAKFMSLFKKKQKRQMSLDEAYAQIDKKYNERMKNFLEATSDTTEKKAESFLETTSYQSPRLTLDTSSSRQSYEERLNAFYEAHCKAA
jgi:hypothetical protein